MDYLKSFWWKPSKDESQSNVEFSTVQTSVPANAENFCEIREVKSNNSIGNSKSELPSPTESFHTVKSTFNEKSSSRGVSNLGYTGSNQDVTMTASDLISKTPQTSTYTHHHHQQHQQNQQVFHQSYWSWTVPWSSWNQREKILLLVIVILSLCILSLTSALSVVVQKNLQYRDLILDKLQLSV